MRVAHIVGSLEARYGGPSRSVRALAAATAEQGHEVDVLTSAPEALPVETRGRLQVLTWRRGWPGAICRVPDMARHLAGTRYDVIHHHGLWLRTLHYAHRKAQGDGIPLVVSPRGMMSPWAWRRGRSRKALAARCIHPGALAAVSGWHATSPEEAEEIRQLGFSQPVCVAPNGVEPSDPAEVAAARLHWQAVVPGSTTQPVALFFSRFHAKKRVIELIDLWAALAPADWVLLLVGVPEQFTVAQLRAYVRRVGDGSHIEVHDGAGQAPPYAIASLFLLPSHSENFGLVIAEACAHGVPVVVTDTTPWTALERQGLGRCVPWGAYESALRAALAEPPAERQRRGMLARDWVLREFSWTQSARDLAAFYPGLKGGVR
jgi:glycosyltransferase involved in cell wall biosynthesis